jgi:hypothetical protein
MVAIRAIRSIAAHGEESLAFRVERFNSSLMILEIEVQRA